VSRLQTSEHNYGQFFAEMVEAYSQRHPNWYKRNPDPRNYLTFSAGMVGVRLGWVSYQGPDFSVELYISASDTERSEETLNVSERISRPIWVLS